MSSVKELLIILSVFFLLILSVFLIDTQTQVLSGALRQIQKHTYTVVIDSGHGGFDSGKVGIDGTLEKDVNLMIARKLQVLLESSDVEVIMTRTSDQELCDANAPNKKARDLQKRAELMNASRPDCIISIHQNSYPDESIHGAQVFYDTDSEPGKLLAGLIQKELVRGVDPENHRQIKAHDSYYLFRKTSAPIAIVECGFLSNREESKKLVDDAYQQKLAWAIHMGVLQFLNQKPSD
ncbi:MAG: N-acetylmuramoyl-L-alanine amidase [Lachnospiraceae bacterium]